MTGYDLIITGGIVVDGTGTSPYAADVGIRDGRIASIGDLAQASAAEVIDAGGRFVGPGFIDIHTHYDVQIFRDPTLSDTLQNGTTSVVAGNCGIGLAPCKPDARERCMLMLEATEQIPIAVQREFLPWTWESFPEFMQALAVAEKSLNLLMFAPLATIQAYVMGADECKKRHATPGELQRMKDLVSEAMDAGAVGLSLCFLKEANNHVDYDGTPLPTDLMPEDHIVEIASVLRERGDGVVQCLTGRPAVDRTVALTERLAREVGRPVIHSFLPAGREGCRKGLDWHARMNAGGSEIYTQAFNGRGWAEISLMTATCHDLDPHWRQLSHGGEAGVADSLAKLRDRKFRQRMRETYDPVIFDQSSGALEGMTFVQPGLSDEFAGFLGMTLQQIADLQDKHIVDVYADLSIAGGGDAVFKTTQISIDLETIVWQLGHERIVIGGSDGGAHIKAIAHGGWPTDLVLWLVREERVIPIERAHYLMSYQQARSVGLHDRGALLVGMAADIIVYDLDELYYNMDRLYHCFDLPGGDWRKRVTAGGYFRIIVNGEVVFAEDEYCGLHPGRVLRPTAQPPGVVSLSPGQDLSA